MIELSAKQTQWVAGAEQVYVTEEWKERSAFHTGIAMGIFGVLIGSGLIIGPSVAVSAILGCAAIGGLVGFGVGYGLSTLEHMNLENNNWYEFNHLRVM